MTSDESTRPAPAASRERQRTPVSAPGSPEPELALITLVQATTSSRAVAEGLDARQRQVLALTRSPTSVAELSARLALPLGVVRAELERLIAQGLVARCPDRPTDLDLLASVIQGIRRL